MGKQFPAAVTAQGHQADFFQVLGLRRKKFTGEIENNAVQQRRPALCGHAPVRSGSEFALDSGELLGVKIAEGGDWCRRHAHCSDSKIRMRIRYLLLINVLLKGSFALFLITYADGLIHSGKKYLAVADFPGSRGFQYRLDRAFPQIP